MAVSIQILYPGDFFYQEICKWIANKSRSPLLTVFSPDELITVDIGVLPMHWLLKTLLSCSRLGGQTLDPVLVSS